MCNTRIPCSHEEMLLTVAITNLMAADEISRTLKLIKLNELNAEKIVYPETDPGQMLREKTIKELLEDVLQTSRSVASHMRRNNMEN